MPLPFRRRLQVALLLLGTLPTALAVVGWALTVRSRANPAVATEAALQSVARTGRTLVQTVDSTRLTAAERRVLADHTRALNEALSRARRQETEAAYFAPALAGVILLLGVVVLYASVRVGGYLSRQLSRPIDELVGWTAHIQREEPLPTSAATGGAPEFAALRGALRTMAEGLAEARTRRIEAERLRAFREVARRVAHEMKNPLTPIRFAVRSLLASARAEQREPLEVLQAEADRLERLASEFTALGRLPEGPAAEVDLRELLSGLARAIVPPDVPIRLDLDPATPTITGHYEPLRRAFDNLLRNAVEAGPGMIEILCRPLGQNGAEVRLTDHGPGVPEAIRDRLFDPYVTGKPHGTGLGLALARQAVEAHGGRIRHEPAAAGVEDAPPGATFVVTLPRVRRASGQD